MIPWLRPLKADDIIGNCNTGSAFRDTYKALVKEPGQQLVGVLYYIDGAITGQFSDLPVTAVKTSLSIFTRKARLRPDVWATLGYLPHVKISKGRGKKLFVDSGHMEADDLHMMDGEGEQIDGDGNISDNSDVGLTEIKAQDFHFMLRVILDSHMALQQRGILWTFMHGQKRYPAHLLFFVVMCRWDTKEADALCGKHKPRTRNIKHVCRQCHVPTMEASDHLARHPTKTQEQIEKLVKKQKLTICNPCPSIASRIAGTGCVLIRQIRQAHTGPTHWRCCMPCSWASLGTAGIFSSITLVNQRR